MKRRTIDTCTKCGANDRTPSGSCRICSKYSQDRIKANTPPEELRARQRAAAKKSYWAMSEAERKAKNRKRLCKAYGLTPEAFSVMLERQGNACKICDCTEPSEGKNFHVDHCHKTGRVRGILCHHCNIAIGLLREDVRIAKRVLEYLEVQTGKIA